MAIRHFCDEDELHQCMASLEFATNLSENDANGCFWKGHRGIMQFQDDLLVSLKIPFKYLKVFEAKDDCVNPNKRGEDRVINAMSSLTGGMFVSPCADARIQMEITECKSRYSKSVISRDAKLIRSLCCHKLNQNTLLTGFWCYLLKIRILIF